MNTNNADTTGLRGIPRAKALIACAEAQDAGKTIQLRGEYSEKWVDANHRCDFGDLKTNYRVKPEPVVTTKRVYEVYIPMGERPLKCAGNYMGTYQSRDEALAGAASGFAGSALIQMVQVVYHDGDEFSREDVLV